MEMGYYPGGDDRWELGRDKGSGRETLWRWGIIRGGMTGGNLAGIRGQGGRLCGDGVLSGGDDRWELGRDKGPGRETLWRWGIIRGG